MNPKVKVALFATLTLVLTGLLIYLIYVAWKQDVDAARQILLATTVIVGLGALTAGGFTVLGATNIAKNKQEASAAQAMYAAGAGAY